ncbi:outer membrane beta-barrel protein [Riemerella columbina]|uniref:outer membrane beta-barrel protein n=1 Tax=Riemerella columbina TaxID=103810 RepID=UPI00266F13F4|nr:outer membrane beta-barrel protein [Riemerella columbina]WKS95045.1 PorT family protein [Riemerella columbina]
MKKVLATLAIAASSMMMAQVSFGLRSNVLLNTSSPSWTDLKNNITDAVETNGKNITGFNVGLSAKVDLPVTSLFVMPEVYYTYFASKTTVDNTEIKANSNRIDVPVLLGYNILVSNISLFAGPVASYNLASEGTFNDFKENATKNFTIGYQLGANVKLSKLVLNARYEGAFSKDERSFIKTVSGGASQEVRYDNRPSFFLLGLGYEF